ncbi:MAG TPA: S1 family peptidase [Actinomycetes bacterium]|nr:S1 family peptidase [Actinomycetes bacterium]
MAVLTVSRTRLAAIAAVALAALLVLPASRAAASGSSLTPAQRLAAAERLSRALGARAAGVYLDRASGAVVVNVLDAAGAGQARALGAHARTVAYSLPRLERARAALDRAAGPAGAAWGVDVVANAVSISLPAGAPSARAAAFLARARSLGVRVRVERVAGEVATQAFYGGQAIYGTTGGRCTAAFMTRSRRGNWYALTAGHCTSFAPAWETAGGAMIGPSAAASFPGDDFGAIRISNPGALRPQGAVLDDDGVLAITGAADPVAGSAACKTGSTTGTTCGTVLRTNVTVRYAEGTVYGLTETNLCTQPGDSGGPLFSGNTAEGIVSGGTTGPCGPRFRSYFQPVTEALAVYGLTLAAPAVVRA